VSATRITSERSEVLLDQVFEIIAAEGFASLKMADLTRRLVCSPNTLYKLAPTKESLLARVIKRWSDGLLDSAHESVASIDSPSERARLYYNLVTAEMYRVSSQFRTDVAHFDTTANVWVGASERFVGEFSRYLGEAARVGEVRQVNARFLALILQQVATVTRDEATIAECGLTKEEAHREIDLLIWQGISAR